MGYAFVKGLSVLSVDVCQEDDNRLTIALVCGLFALIMMVTVVALVIISKSRRQSYTLRSGVFIHNGNCVCVCVHRQRKTLENVSFSMRLMMW